MGRFNRASAYASDSGLEARAHCGVVASALDECFVWMTTHAGGAGPTAWLDVTFFDAVPLDETLYVDVVLDTVEASKSGRQKVRFSARLCRLLRSEVASI